MYTYYMSISLPNMKNKCYWKYELLGLFLPFVEVYISTKHVWESFPIICYDRSSNKGEIKYKIMKTQGKTEMEELNRGNMGRDS